MSKPLYIVWNDEFAQGEAIIDEQHRGVMATINSLHYFLQQGATLDHLLPTVKILMSYIIFHYKTEEGILSATEYPDIKQYQQKMKTKVAEFKAAVQSAINNNDPEGVLLFLKEWWINHLDYHEDITPYLNEWSGEYCRLDETG